MLCPVTHRQVDERGARIVALLVVLLVTGAALLPATAGALLLAALCVDFAVRGLVTPRWSPLARTAGIVLRLAGATPAPTNAGPKMFAARLGATMTAAILATVLLGATAATWALTATLAGLAGLEAAFGFCVACRIYPLLVSTGRTAADHRA